MPQRSQPYAIGRVRALSRSLFTRAVLERMRAAADMGEMAKVLAECGWGEAHTQAEMEALADKQVAEACRLVREITPDADVTDCFLLRYDILNLKALFKARMLGARAPALSPNGVYDPETLRHAVSEARYDALPAEVRPALEEIEDRVAAEPDPLFVDARLDRLLFEMTRTRIKRARRLEPPLRAYFAARADAANILIALRVHRMGREAALAEEMFVAGGTLTAKELTRVTRDPTTLLPLARGRLDAPFARALEAGLARTGAGLALLEKRLDDYLLSLIRPGRYDVLGLLPVVGYLLAREREAAAVRLLASAKAVNASQEQLEARLRETYA